MRKLDQISVLYCLNKWTGGHAHTFLTNRDYWSYYFFKSFTLRIFDRMQEGIEKDVLQRNVSVVIVQDIVDGMT